MRAVPALDVPEDRQAGLRLGLEGVPVEQLALEAGEERLAEGVVVGVAHRAHRRQDGCLPAPLAEGYRGVLGAVVGVVDDPGRLALRDSGVQGREDEVGLEVVAVAQPTTLRLQTSMTTARKRKPAQVELNAPLPRDVVVDSKVEETAAKFGRILADSTEATKTSVLSAG